MPVRIPKEELLQNIRASLKFRNILVHTSLQRVYHMTEAVQAAK